MDRFPEELDLEQRLPILLYSNDPKFKQASGWGGAVYKSTAVNRSHQLMLTREISNKKPSIEDVIGAESAQITGRTYPVGYLGNINGNEFNAQKGNEPLVIIHGVLSEAGYKHDPDKEYGFLYMVTTQGTISLGRRRNADKAEVPAVTAVLAVLPQKNYDEMVQNQFRNAEQFVLNMLPDPWKAYLTEGGFFSKPRIIGMIDAQSPHLNYVSFR